MTPLVIFLIIASFLSLVLGFFAWKATNSRGAIIATLLSSTGLLLAAYHLASNQHTEATIGIAFLAGMLMGGRGTGWFIRSYKEPALRYPAVLMSSASVLCLAGAIAAYKNIN